MRYSLYIFILLAVLPFLACNENPDIKSLEEDLGVKIPKHKLEKGFSNNIGLHSSSDYVLSFDSLNFEKLVASIESSSQYNYASWETLGNMSLKDNLNLISQLSKSKMVGFWTKSEREYTYINIYPNLNPKAKISYWQIENSILLQNQKILIDSSFSSAQTGLYKKIKTTYSINASVNLMEKRLYYTVLYL